MEALCAGTRHPTWAISVITPTIRMYVDLPPMLGPVIRIIPPPCSILPLEPQRSTSLEMKDLPSIFSSTMGCLPALTTRPLPERNISGLEYVSGASAATQAKPRRTSNSAIVIEQSSNTGRYVATTSKVFLRSSDCLLLYSSARALYSLLKGLNFEFVKRTPSFLVSMTIHCFFPRIIVSDFRVSLKKYPMLSFRSNFSFSLSTLSCDRVSS
mmetsp:Transcript_6222/g.18773  ORF Transcript_6222/g.18773 Transcript_6222/m.18773 type:complete len:212 (+) Transcript_6222:1019-1654(+)